VSKNTLTAEIDPENLASTKVIKKLGFIEGERIKEACQFWIDARNGRTGKRDLVVWHLARPE
jgi:RimJ/RimL family protein N-acetyltransferase